MVGIFHTPLGYVPSRSHSDLYPTMLVISVARFAPGSSLVGHSCLVSLQFHISLWGIASFIEIHSEVSIIRKVDKSMPGWMPGSSDTRVRCSSFPNQPMTLEIRWYSNSPWSGRWSKSHCPNRSLLTLLKSISSTPDHLTVASSFAIKFEGKYIVSCL